MAKASAMIEIPIDALRRLDDLLGVEGGTMEKRLLKIVELDRASLDTLALLADPELAAQIIEGIERCKRGEGAPREAIWEKERQSA